MRVVLLLAVTVGALHAAPAPFEGSSRQCEAVAHLAASTIAAHSDKPALEAITIGTGTLMASRYAKTHNPDLPVSVTCAGLYYRIALDPDGARFMLEGDNEASRGMTAESLFHVRP